MTVLLQSGHQRPLIPDLSFVVQCKQFQYFLSAVAISSDANTFDASAMAMI